MNKQQQLRLAAFFEELAEAELALDILKTELATCKTFSGEALFNNIAEGSQEITIGQLTAYTNSKSPFSQRDIYELFQRFDWHRNGVISKPDFLSQLTPESHNPKLKPSAATATTSKPTAQCQGIFLAVLKQYINRLQILQVCRQDLSNIPPYNAYDQVAANRKGFLGLSQLKSFMRQCDMQMKDSMLQLLLYALKRRCYRFVNLEVFCENLWPLEFGYYQGYEERLREEGEEMYLRRSRKEEEEVNRLRVDKQKAEGQLRKEERRLEAQLRRGLEEENEARVRIQQDMQEGRRVERRGQLESEKEARWAAEQGQLLLAEEARLAEMLRIRMLEADAAKRSEEEVYYRVHREAALERSRRERELEIEEESRNQIRADLEKERALRVAQQLEEERLSRQEILAQREKNLFLERQRQAAIRKQLQLDRLKQAAATRPLYPAPDPILQPYIQPYRKYRQQLDRRLREEQIQRVKYTPSREAPKYSHYLVDKTSSDHKKVQNQDIRANLDSRYSRYSSSKKKQPAASANAGPGFITFGKRQPQVRMEPQPQPSVQATPQQPAGGKYNNSQSKTREDSNKKVTFDDSRLKRSYIV